MVGGGDRAVHCGICYVNRSSDKDPIDHSLPLKLGMRRGRWRVIDSGRQTSGAGNGSVASINRSLVLSPCLDFISQECSATGRVSIGPWPRFSSNYRSRGVPLAASSGALRRQIGLRCQIEEGSYGCFYGPCFRERRPGVHR
jgi:hypothetical protein